MHRYSAILTTYNAEHSILRALDSILGQEISPAEIIVVDDQSSDLTLNKISEYQLHTPQIRVFQNSRNLGVAYSRNFGIKRASEDLIIFFDDDDISLKQRSRVHLNLFSLGADVTYVSSVKKYLNGYVVQNVSDDYIGTLEISDFAKRQLLGKKGNLLATPASCMAINRNIALKIGGFDSELKRLEDTDIAIRLASLNVKFGFSSQICVERFDLGKKISKFEGVSQKIILHKHRGLLTDRQFRDAIFKTEVRDLYFHREFVRLLLRLLKELCIHPTSIGYLALGIKRLKHDWQKR